MTPTHLTRDGRPVTIEKTGKRWMRGWIVQEGATFRPRWHLNGEHPRDEALDLTPVANAHLAAIIARSRDLFDDIPEPDPRDAEIERLRGEGLALATLVLSDYMSWAEAIISASNFIARNGGAK